MSEEDPPTPEPVGFPRSLIRAHETNPEYLAMDVETIKDLTRHTFPSVDLTKITENPDEVCALILEAVRSEDTDHHGYHEENERLALLSHDLILKQLPVEVYKVYIDYIVSVLEVKRVSDLSTSNGIDFRPLKDLLYTGLLRFMYSNSIPYSYNFGRESQFVSQKFYLDRLLGDTSTSLTQMQGFTSPQPTKRDTDQAPDAPKVEQDDM